MVTESKPILFLDEVVIGRAIRPSRVGKKQVEEVGEGEEEVGEPSPNTASTEPTATISFATVDVYVAAIGNLYSQQASRGKNLHPNPRTKAVNNRLESVRRGEAERRKREFSDRAISSILDGYNRKNFRDICHVLWTKASSQPAREEIWLRTMVDILFGHYFLTRGEDRRFVLLPDMQYLSLEEGPGSCHSLLMIMHQGKRNQHGKTEYAAALRNKDEFACPMGALAMYLYCRWKTEPFPDFSNKSNWFPTHVLKANSPTSAISQPTQGAWSKIVFQEAGVKMSKTTHAGRSSGSRMAESMGVAEGQIRRAGRWNNDSMTSAYLSSLPRQFMRAMAGFPKDDENAYYLPRAQVVPSLPLVGQIWPQLDLAVEDYRQKTAVDITTGGHLELLLASREILLQDSVLLRSKWPTLYQDPVFNCPEYRDFADQLQASMAGEELVPRHLLIQRAMPEVVTTMNAGFQSVGADIRVASESHNQKLKRIQDDLADIADSSWEMRRIPPGLRPEQRSFSAAQTVYVLILFIFQHRITY